MQAMPLSVVGMAPYCCRRKQRHLPATPVLGEGMGSRYHRPGEAQPPQTAQPAQPSPCSAPSPHLPASSSLFSAGTWAGAASMWLGLGAAGAGTSTGLWPGLRVVLQGWGWLGWPGTGGPVAMVGVHRQGGGWGLGQNGRGPGLGSCNGQVTCCP